MNCNRLDCYLGAAPGDSQPQAPASDTNKVLIVLAIAVGALYLLSKRRK